MSDLREEQDGAFQGDCCMSHSEGDGRAAGWNRREFLATAGLAAAAGAALPTLLSAASSQPREPQRQPPIRLTLRVQPVFNCEIYERKPATSWRVTGAIQNEQELREEEGRIRRDLAEMAAAATFPLEILPLVTVRSVEQATAAAKGNHDVLIMYAARRNRPVLEALAATDKWNLMFVRHRSGPLYYMYIGAHTHFLRKTRDEYGEPHMTVQDVVVDDHGELLWRLRALYGVKNTLGRRVVAIGGPSGWGEAGRGAPDRAIERWKLDIRTVTYPELGERIKKARQNAALVRRCEADADRYLRQRGVSLETSREFVQKAFVLTEVFRDLLDEAQTDAITVSSCMSTIMPISETTACLPLTLLNDEGYMAFCEGDFVAIPAGILLRQIAGTPVFFCNPSFPHNGIVTVSHCTAPRKMDGRRFEHARLVTHYESDYGAAPKVEMRKGQAITVIDSDFAGQRWLGFQGKIADTPFFPICRTQLDIAIQGNWETLRDEARGFHWMVSYGSYLRELGYAVKKAGVDLLKVS
jgi:hypothetical protein